jgi:hypothetical protein
VRDVNRVTNAADTTRRRLHSSTRCADGLYGMTSLAGSDEDGPNLVGSPGVNSAVTT